MAVADIIRLERMSHVEKLRHWNRKAPWQVNGKPLRLPKPEREIRRGHMIVEEGHVRKMPPLIGRPCFGSPVAYLRHGGQQQFFNQRTRQWTLTRCMRCPVRDACELVAEQRLNANDDIRTARFDFEKAGGRKAMWHDNASQNWVVPWKRLMVELERHGPFENVNDLSVAQWCEAKEREYRDKDRARKSAARKKEQQDKAKRAEFTPELLAAFNRERIYRRDRYRRACTHPTIPWRIKQAGATAADFDTHVWMARELLRVSGQSDTAYGVAAELRRRNIGTSKTVNALRSRVGKALERIDLLARLRLDGNTEPVLPPLNIREVIREAAKTPYEMLDA